MKPVSKMHINEDDANCDENEMEPPPVTSQLSGIDAIQPGGSSELITIDEIIQTTPHGIISIEEFRWNLLLLVLNRFPMGVYFHKIGAEYCKVAGIVVKPEMFLEGATNWKDVFEQTELSKFFIVKRYILENIDETFFYIVPRVSRSDAEFLEIWENASFKRIMSYRKSWENLFKMIGIKPTHQNNYGEYETDPDLLNSSQILKLANLYGDDEGKLEIYQGDNIIIIDAQEDCVLLTKDKVKDQNIPLPDSKNDDQMVENEGSSRRVSECDKVSLNIRSSKRQQEKKILEKNHQEMLQKEKDNYMQKKMLSPDNVLGSGKEKEKESDEENQNERGNENRIESDVLEISNECDFEEIEEKVDELPQIINDELSQQNQNHYILKFQGNIIDILGNNGTIAKCNLELKKFIMPDINPDNKMMYKTIRRANFLLDIEIENQWPTVRKNSASFYLLKMCEGDSMSFWDNIEQPIQLIESLIKYIDKNHTDQLAFQALFDENTGPASYPYHKAWYNQIIKNTKIFNSDTKRKYLTRTLNYALTLDKRIFEKEMPAKEAENISAFAESSSVSKEGKVGKISKVAKKKTFLKTPSVEKKKPAIKTKAAKTLVQSNPKVKPKIVRNTLISLDYQRLNIALNGLISGVFNTFGKPNLLARPEIGQKLTTFEKFCENINYDSTTSMRIPKFDWIESIKSIAVDKIELDVEWDETVKFLKDHWDIGFFLDDDFKDATKADYYTFKNIFEDAKVLSDRVYLLKYI